MSGTGTPEDPWLLTTPPGTSAYTIHLDGAAQPAELVCNVGTTRLRYLARCLADVPAMLRAHGDWVELGSADENKPAKAPTEPTEPSYARAMAEFVDEDLSEARFERVNLHAASFTAVQLDGALMRRVDLRGIDIRGARLDGARLRGVELCDVEISGEVRNVTVNGIDIAPLVEQELNRLLPERAKMHPADADGFREAWAILDRLWATTIERARSLPADSLHARLDGEWSFVETLRHLGFASAAWVGRMILGDPSPWHPLDLPWDEAPGWDGIPWDRDARPTLDAVLALRDERRAMVGRVIAGLTDEQLAVTVSNTEPGWPRLESFPLRECLQIVLIEEWEHRRYAERDLDALDPGTGRG